MRRNGALETHVGKVQSSNSLPTSATWDPNPIAEACSSGLVTSQDSFVWAVSYFRFEGNESQLVGKVGRILDQLKELDGQKFPTNRFVGNFLQSTYKIDMCLLACEKHMLS
jgi:hypothetical protein